MKNLQFDKQYLAKALHYLIKEVDENKSIIYDKQKDQFYAIQKENVVQFTNLAGTEIYSRFIVVFDYLDKKDYKNRKGQKKLDFIKEFVDNYFINNSGE